MTTSCLVHGYHGEGPCPDHREQRIERYRAAAAAVAAARIRYAESFLLWKARDKGTSDEKARQHAIVETRDELTILLAELEIARESLNRA